MASTAAPRRSSPPPPHLSEPILERLGKHRLLRFSEPLAGGDSTSGQGRRWPSPSAALAEGVNDDEDDGDLDRVREKLLGHLRRMKLAGALLAAESPQPPEPAAESTVVAAARPSKARARRTPRTRMPPVAVPPRSLPPRAAAAAPERTVRLRSEDVERPKEERRPTIAVSLSREEIEEDIFGLTGSRPRRRPKKRPRPVQRRLDTLFPGLWLADITAERYKVDD